MNYLEKLLQGRPVEWVTLGEVVTIITAPSKVKKEKYCLHGKNPIIDQGERFIAGYTDENFPLVPNGEYIIFGDHSEHIKYVDFPFIQGADGLKILRSNSAITKYLYYAFLNFYRKEQNYKRHWSNAKETLIPIPPLDVQKEIVDILDKMCYLQTALQTALQTELTLRQKQYSYYRDLLLNFDSQDQLGGG